MNALKGDCQYMNYSCCFRTFSHRRHLGGKLGAQLKRVFGIEHLGELTNVSLSELEGAFGAKTRYMYIS